MKYIILALLLSLAGNGWQLYSAGGDKPKCQLALNQQVQQQNQATQADQHQADVQHVAEVKKQAAKANVDEISDAGEVAGLQTRIASQTDTIDQLRRQLKGKTDAKPFDPLQCLDTPVPAALLSGLQQPAGGSAQPPR